MKKILFLSLLSAGLLQASFYTNQTETISNCLTKNLPDIIEQANKKNNFMSLVSETEKLMGSVCPDDLKTYHDKISWGLKYQYGTDQEKEQSKNHISFKEQEEIDTLDKTSRGYISNKLNKWETKLITLTVIAQELGKYNKNHHLNIKQTDEEILLINKCLTDNKKVINFLSKKETVFNKKIGKLKELTKKFCPVSYDEYATQWFLSNQSTLSYIYNNEEILNDEETTLLQKYFPSQFIIYSIQ